MFVSHVLTYKKRVFFFAEGRNMSDEFLRQLTHDDDIFDKEWSITFHQIDHFFEESLKNSNDIISFKGKTIDAVVDYVLAEPITTTKPIYTKQLLVEKTLQLCAADDPFPSLGEIVRSLKRILDLPDIFNEWHLICIRAFHYKFQLCERLSSTKSTELVAAIFQSLKKHSFLNDQVSKDVEDKWQELLSRIIFSPLSMDSNKLNHEDLMLAMRPAFQEFFR